MKKMKNLEVITGGKVVQVVLGDSNISTKDGTILYGVTSNVSGKIEAYFLGYEQAANYDRFINNGFGPMYVRNSDDIYEELDCYEITKGDFNAALVKAKKNTFWKCPLF